MDTSEIVNKAEFVYNNLRMKTFPIGVKFLKHQEELPEKARRPSQFLKKKITICQAMTMARIYGWQMGMTREDVICILASLAFGFTTAEDPRKEMAKSFFESMYKSDMEKTVKEVEQMCFLDGGEYQAILIAPLPKISIIPDTIVLYGNPAQMSRILQAATYDRDEKIQGLFGGKVECPEYLIRPLKTGEPRIIIPGPGDRIFSMTGDDEMIFAMPYAFLDRFIMGLRESGKKAGARYPITYYQNFQPEFPAHYQALGEKYGIKTGVGGFEHDSVWTAGPSTISNLETGGCTENVSQDYHTFKARNGDFNYIDWGGSGTLAHFSHATGFCAETYTPIAEKLCRRLRVVGMDDRGHGKTTAPADPRDLKEWDVFADDLERFFEYLGEPVIAVGHSRGAVASLLLAVKRPDMIRALILIDPTILPFSWMWWWFLAKKTGLARFVPIATRAACRNPLWPDRETILNAYRSRQPFSLWKEGFLEGYISCGTLHTDDGGIRLSCTPAWESRCFAVCSHDIWRKIPRIQQPTLILYGKESDTFLAPAVKRFQAKLPHAVIRGFENTTHFVPMERPDETVEAVFVFLEEKGLF